MSTTQTGQPLTFHCTACNGRIQTPAQFAGVSAPCPFCAQIVTAPRPAPAQWAPAPAAIQRAAIRRLPLPTKLSDPPIEAVQVAPREIKPRQETMTAVPSDPGLSQLDEIFRRMMEMEGQVDSRPRLKRKGKVPFERPLRRTDDRSLQVSR